MDHIVQMEKHKFVAAFKAAYYYNQDKRWVSPHQAAERAWAEVQKLKGLGTEESYRKLTLMNSELKKFADKR